MSVNKILILSHRDLIRESIAVLIKQQSTIAEVLKATTGEQAIKIVYDTNPDVIIIDIEAKEPSVIDTITKIIKFNPLAKILVLSTTRENPYLMRALKAGAKSCVIDNIPVDSFIKTITLVSEGDMIIPGSMAISMITRLYLTEDTKPPELVEQYTNLTKRELEVLDLVAKKYSNKKIAHDLVITEDTVKVHLRNIMEKLNVRNRRQAAQIALDTVLSRRLR